MKASLRNSIGILRTMISIILFFVVICVPIIIEIIMPLTSWGTSFLTNLEFDNYSFYSALLKFSTGAVIAHALCIILFAFKLMIALLKRTCHFISTLMN